MPDRVDGILRRRKRPAMQFSHDEIAKRIEGLYQSGLSARSNEAERRIQRIAKYRMWSEGRDYPWEDASDALIPDLMTHCLRMSDTLHNAVMSVTPPITSNAINPSDRDKQDSVDNLIDYQFFVEQPGETKVGELIDSFVMHGIFTAFVPWVKERRELREICRYAPIPEDALPFDYFSGLLQEKFPNAMSAVALDKDGWDFRVQTAKDAFTLIKFYSVSPEEPGPDDGIEMVIEQEIVVFDGPCLIPKSWDDVITPARCANLQIPGPSNPGGAPYVIIRDYPTKDEINDMIRTGYYKAVKPGTKEEIERSTRSGIDEAAKVLYDDLQGEDDIGSMLPEEARGMETLTRLIVFDRYDIDGDGRPEDVMWWYIVETKSVLRARHLTDHFPSNPVRRPFGESCFIPVEGRRSGIGMLEMMEGSHDLLKEIADQTIDGGTISMIPFGFYRAIGGVRPEVIRLWPGEMYPVADPVKDVNFPRVGNTNSAFGLNMATMIDQWQQKLTMVGDIQLGRVPVGRSSALRTVGAMQMIAGQGEARPERIIRRLFIGLVEIWQQFHELNQVFLPQEKQIRLRSNKVAGQDPYMTIKQKSIATRMQFTFKTNVFNASRAALQAAYQQLMGLYATPLAIQLGIAQPDGLFRLFRDYGHSLGVDPDRYITPPTAETMMPRLFFEEALHQIINDIQPMGVPEETGGAQEHLEKAMEFARSENFGFLKPHQVTIFQNWVRRVVDLGRAQAQRAAVVQAAAASQPQGEGGGAPPQPQIPNMSNPPVNENELLDEAMPSAGGGAAMAQMMSPP